MQTFKVRQVLLNKQQQLEDRLNRIISDMSCTQAISGNDSTLAAQPFDDTMEQQALHTLQELKRIKHVLDKVGKPGQGTCERCGHLIGVHRLNAMPHTTICMQCVKKHHH